MKQTKKIIFYLLALLLLFALLMINFSSNILIKNVHASDTNYKSVTSQNLSASINNQTKLVDDNKFHLFFSSTPIDRTAGSQGEYKTALYIEKLMQDCSLSYFIQETYEQEFNIGGGKKSRNIIGVHKSSTENAPTIVLGAHYDNNYTKHASLGALDNASGVVVNLALMQTLCTQNFNFNIIFAFFGAGNLNNAGSKHFINSLSMENKNNLLLYINFDSIGFGEYTYYYAGDSANSFTSVFSFSKYNISKMPTNAKISTVLSQNAQAYTHQGLISDNVSFIQEGIKSLTFFSGNLNGVNAGYKESAVNQNIINTKNDTPSTVLEYYPNFISRLNDVAEAVQMALINANFISSVQDSYKQIDLTFLNNKLLIFALGIFSVLLLCGIKVNDDKKKEVLLENQNEQTVDDAKTKVLKDKDIETQKNKQINTSTISANSVWLEEVGKVMPNVKKTSKNNKNSKNSKSSAKTSKKTSKTKNETSK